MTYVPIRGDKLVYYGKKDRVYFIYTHREITKSSTGETITLVNGKYNIKLTRPVIKYEIKEFFPIGKKIIIPKVITETKEKL